MNITGIRRINDFATFILMKAGTRISFPPFIKINYVVNCTGFLIRFFDQRTIINHLNF